MDHEHQQMGQLPMPIPLMETTVYLAPLPWDWAQQLAVSPPQLVLYQVLLVTTVFQRAQVAVPLASTDLTKQAAKLGLKKPSLKLMQTKSLPLQQCSKQRHFKSQQFQAQSAKGMPVVTSFFWAVYQNSWFLTIVAEAKAIKATKTIKSFIDMICLQF